MTSIPLRMKSPSVCREFSHSLTTGLPQIGQYLASSGKSEFPQSEQTWISESFVDREEREMLESELEWLLKDYRRAKRNKTPFNPNSQWYNKALIKRVAELGEKATIEGIHRPMSNHYRRDLAEEMEKNGYEDIDIIKWIYPEKWFEKLSKGWDWRTDEY